MSATLEPRFSRTLILDDTTMTWGFGLSTIWAECATLSRLFAPRSRHRKLSTFQIPSVSSSRSALRELRYIYSGRTVLSTSCAFSSQPLDICSRQGVTSPSAPPSMALSCLSPSSPPFLPYIGSGTTFEVSTMYPVLRSVTLSLDVHIDIRKLNKHSKGYNI